MPAVSKAQQRLMAACEHGAGYSSCPKDMTKQQMHDFAATPRTGLPARAKMGKSQRAMRDRSTKGSPPYTIPEFRVGYRRV